MKKAVLIAAPNDFSGNVNAAQFTTLLAPPLGILALGSYLASHDVPVELIDVQVDFGFGLGYPAEKAVADRVVGIRCVHFARGAGAQGKSWCVNTKCAATHGHIGRRT